MIAKRREIMDGDKMQGSSMTYREVLTKKIADLKEINIKKGDFEEDACKKSRRQRRQA